MCGTRVLTVVSLSLVAERSFGSEEKEDGDPGGTVGGAEPGGDSQSILSETRTMTGS